LVKSAAPSRAFEVMRDTGILEVTCPPVAAMPPDDWTETMGRLDACPRTEEIRLAALLLDARLSHRDLDRWLRQMRFSNAERQRVAHLVENGRFELDELASPTALRRWLARVGRDLLGDVLALASADGIETTELAERARKVIDAGLPLSTQELAVSGQDVMSILSVPQGRHVGEVLEWLFEHVLDEPDDASREALLALISVAHEATREPNHG
jgi:tRNA nucleotidyltransferase/poly(A) polymerase